MDHDAVIRLFKHLQKQSPEPETELNYTTPFELLTAVMLSAQSTDIGVNKATAKLFPIANTPEGILELGEDKLKQYISTLGLYNSKAQHLLATCQLLVHQYNNQVPDNRKALESLPGVGRKTANVLLNILFDQPTIAVDTHIFRVGNRTGLAPGKTPRDVENRLLKVVPDKFRQHAHHWLILHGRYICKARKPQCHLCPIEQECEWPEKPTA
ncbi:MAG: endonuclease III [Mariprofundaceae bacterium]